MTNRILISGAGIGGLTAAIALRRAGFPVCVLEQTPVFSDVGAGLSVGPSATRAMDALGLGEILRGRADLPKRQAVLRHDTLGIVTEGMDGYRALDADGRSWLHQIHRSDFHDMLVTAAVDAGVDLRLGQAVVDFEQDADGVQAILGDGARLPGEVLVSADGLRSSLRVKMFEQATPSFTGQVAFRCLVPMEKVAHLMGDHQSATIMGPGAILTRYPVRHGRLLNCVGIVATHSWTQEGWSHVASSEEFASHYEGWHRSVDDIIGATRGEPIIKWALYDHAPLARWSRGRVVLLGDAAHPILPFLGLGAAMAIEDGIVLARALKEHAAPLTAIDRYQENRRDRTAVVRARAREQGRLYQSKSAAEYVASWRPASDPVFFNYDAATVPLN